MQPQINPHFFLTQLLLQAITVTSPKFPFKFHESDYFFISYRG